MKTRLISLFILLFCIHAASAALWPIKYDVRDYGAKADDNAIDTAGIQYCLDQASNGIPIQVFIGPGTFLVNRTVKHSGIYGGALALLVHSNTVVRGAGAQATIVKMDSSEILNTAVFHVIASTKRVEFYDLTVDGNVNGRGLTSTVENEGINFKGTTYGVVGNCEIRFCPADAIDLDSAHMIRIFNTHCWSNGSSGFHANGISEVTISQCLMESNGFYRTLEADGASTGGGMDVHFPSGNNAAENSIFKFNYGRNALVQAGSFNWINCDFTGTGIFTNLVSTNSGFAIVNNCQFLSDNNSAVSFLLAPSINPSFAYITQCRFNGNGRGLYAPGGAGGVIMTGSECSVIGSHQVNIVGPSPGLQFVNNNFVNNSSGGGIRLEGAGNSLITGNRFNVITALAFQNSDSTNNIVSGNKFIGGNINVLGANNVFSGNSMNSGITLRIDTTGNRLYGNKLWALDLRGTQNEFSGNTILSTITETGVTVHDQKWIDNIDGSGDPIKAVPNIGGMLALGTNAHMCIVTNPSTPGTPGTVAAWMSVTNWRGGRFFIPVYQ